MDKFDQELKRDAAAIRADISPELAARLNASIHAAGPLPAKPPRRKPGITWWWLSSLTGAAGVFLVIVLSNRGPGPAVAPPTVAGESPPAHTGEIPDIVTAPLTVVPLDVRRADFAEPLADELDNLKSDIDKAKEKLGRDLRFTL